MNLYRVGMAAAGIAALFLAMSAPAADPAPDFLLKEQLGHVWFNECVSFPLTSDQLKAARQGRALVGPGGEETAWQLVETGGVPRLAFQCNLASNAPAGFSFSTSAAKPATELEVADAGDLIRLTNGKIGIELRKALVKPGEGPIARLRLESGAWTGGSSVEGGAAVKDYVAEIAARGPVFAEAVCRTTFADGGAWTIRFRLERGEPVVRIEEQFDAPGGGVFRVTLGDAGYRPTHVFYRGGCMPVLGSVSSGPVGEKGPVFYLEPWLHWWGQERKGNWFALYTPTAVAPPKGGTDIKAAGPDSLVDELTEGLAAKPADPHPDMLMAGVMRPEAWRDPAWKGKARQAECGVSAEAAGGLVSLAFPLQGGRRVWMLATPEKAPNVETLTRASRQVAPPANGLLVKQGIFPLDEVKDYVLEWEGDFDNHPRLFIRKADLPALQARLTSDPREIRRWTSQQPLDKYFLDEPIKEYFASRHEKLGQLLAAKADEYLQTCVNRFLVQNELPGIGVGPHMQTLMCSAVNLTDAMLATPSVTPELRKRLLAQIAFLGYVVNRPDYWSPERGFSANPNMTTTVALYQTLFGCMIPSHPRAKDWAAKGLGELRRELAEWSDEDGGWLEAPHYAMASYDHILGGFIMARQAGYGDYLYEERMRKVLDWFAAISTPGDSRTGGFRHHPPIGNTYHGEPTGMFGIAAGLWKERDPAFAARMQGLHEAMGSFPNMGIGGGYPTMSGYTFLLRSHGVAAGRPDHGSSWFRKTGVVLRDKMGSPRETYLHLIAGPNHEHYDYDSGSLVVYGKGRVLADDWGYIGRHPDQWHSMLTSPSAGGVMRIDAFAPGAALDYVSGRKGSWQRQIAFVKSSDPETGPAFFLIRDTHAADEPATWRLWLTAQEREAAPPGGTPAAVDVAASMAAGGDALKRGGGVDDLLTEGLGGGNKAAGPAGPGVTIHDQGATLVGGEDVDLDIFIFEAAKLGLKTETATQKVTCGYRDGKVGAMANTQTALIGKLAGRGAVAALLVPRLKTEPVSKVTWFADGRGAEVTTPGGTDYVFLSPEPRREAEPDGKSLLPLQGALSVSGKRASLVYKPADADMPQLTVNTSGVDLVEEGYFMPAGSIALHPAPTNPATIAWQSPISGTVSAAVTLRDADVRGGDGIAYELRQGDRTLVQGIVTNGGAAAFNSAVTVAKGDLLRLLILPRATNWWDTTGVEMTVLQDVGVRWDLREAALSGKDFGNAAPGAAGAAWWVCEGDAASLKAEALAPAETFATADGAVAFQGSGGAVQVRGGTTTLTLGAGGTIRAAGRELAAGGPATRTETR